MAGGVLIESFLFSILLLGLLAVCSSGILAREGIIPASSSAKEQRTLDWEEDRELPPHHGRKLVPATETYLHDVYTSSITIPSTNPTPAVITVPSTTPITVFPTNPTMSPVTIPPMNPVSTPIIVPATNPSYPTTPVTTPSVPVTNPTTTPTTFPINPPATNPPVTVPSSVPTTPVVSGQTWCVAKAGALDAALQLALDYACGIGSADCSAIQSTGSCYSPDTLVAHASYAFNSYYQRNPVASSCDFGGTAMLVNVNPSSGACSFPTSSSSIPAYNPTATGISSTPGSGSSSSSVLNTNNPSSSNSVFGSDNPTNTISNAHFRFVSWTLLLFVFSVSYVNWIVY